MLHFLKHLWQRELSERAFWFGMGIVLVVFTMVVIPLLSLLPNVLTYLAVATIAFSSVALARWCRLQWQLYREEYPKQKRKRKE